MELELGLALPNQTPMAMKRMDLNSAYINNNNNGLEMGKRNSGFVDRNDDDDEDEVESKGLSLLLWSGQPNDEDDGDGNGGYRRWRRLRGNINGDENDEIVGWPPINSSRKELLHRHQGGNNNRMANNHHRANRVMMIRRSMYVKVKMEGVPIGRKVDLRIFDSYRALTNTVVDMFAKYNKNDSKDGDYTILYQDKEGDWMLAGDVPWETFVESVQRIEIRRKKY